MLLAHAEISCSALQHNLAVVRRHAPLQKVMACIKANGYGHGALEVADALHDADGLAVARLSEAIRLREHGDTRRILMLEGVLDAGELGVAAAHDCDLVVHSLYQLEALECAHLHRPVNVWLKIDSGMHRVGVEPVQAAHFYQRLRACPSVAELRMMTHFASADEVRSSETLAQIERFNAAVASLDGECSLANSAAILRYPQALADWVRPGIMLYGVSPCEQCSAAHFDLQPVMTLKSRVIAVREHPAHQPVGYGGIWRSNRDTRLAVVGMGYGDGYPRHAPSGTPVLINGVRYPLVGRVSMDMMSIDIGPDAKVEVGDEVVLWGRGLPVDEIAQASGTIGYELLCGVTRRVEFHYLP